MRTPQAVKDAAKSLTDEFGGHFEHLGQYKGYEAFSLHLHTKVPLGYPWVFLYKEGEEVEPVCGEEVFDIWDETDKNKKEQEQKQRKQQGH